VIAKADQEKYKNFMKSFKLSEEGEQELSLTGMRCDNSEFGIDIAVTHALFENDPCVQLLVAAKVEMDSAEVAAEIKRASSLDPLTGIYNRIYMTNTLSQAIRDASEKDKFSSLHIISIDLYEEMRASLGVSGRDAAITDIAKYLREIIGSGGILGKISDGEFALLLSGTDEEQQTKRAQDLCAQVASHICQAAGKTTQLTVSIGICPITEKITSPDQVLDRAHVACEEVRAAGKAGTGNAARYYTAKLTDANASDDKLIIEVIENTLQKDGFILKFQPFISLQGDATEHYEVLLSMTPEKDNQPIDTNEMFRIVGTNDELGKKIDRWTLLNAAKMLAAHCSAGHDTNLLINITASTLRDTSFAGWLAVALKTANIPAKALILQFSEADASSYLTHAKSFCEAMRNMNVRCGIKHFGCSLDPFKTLAHLDVDLVKIDGSFAADIQHKNEKPDTLKGIITQLNEVKKSSIVPLVENASLLATLWQSGAHYIQGNYVQAASEKMDFVFSDE
ncbi:MAG TPA: EAL domain-containing protein, partial [Pseudomonadales bacterium]|nr:EAL domain-containing protein [Pseudomonadales bacterium]